MKKIDAILNREQEKYPVLINKLSMILEPFALLATGNAPVYIGRIAEEASVFGSEHFSISTEDAQSVKNILEALTHRDPVKDIIDGMPKELKSLLGAAIAVSRLEITKEDF